MVTASANKLNIEKKYLVGGIKECLIIYVCRFTIRKRGKRTNENKNTRKKKNPEMLYPGNALRTVTINEVTTEGIRVGCHWFFTVVMKLSDKMFYMC